jgi:hypothetical protein
MQEILIMLGVLGGIAVTTLFYIAIVENYFGR